MNTSNNNEYISEYMESLTSKSVDIRPRREALYITFWYLLLGCLWILFSDSLLNMLVKDPELIRVIQLAKGWFYVLLTGAYIYTLIYYRIRLLKQATDEIHEGYANLAAMQEELIEKEDEIFELSHYDRMTGLLNWVGLSIAFDNMLQSNSLHKQVVLYIDIDNIKHVNDTLGHDKGNLVLSQIAEKLQAVASEKDILSRISGDEFILIMPYDGSITDLHKKVQQIRKHISTTWKFDRYEFIITASIGVALYPDHGDNLETIIKNADSAMFIAKENGRDQHYLYDEKISKKTEHYIEMVTQIRYGITQNEFVLYYQPIVDLRTGKLKGMEALIRWEHPLKGFLTPYHFIDICEESGQINEIGKWVFESACKQCKQWLDRGVREFKMSVNLSGKRLYNPTLLKDMKEVLDRYDLDASYIQVEITETAVMENLNKAIEILNEIRDLGIVLALDDFGTGYSSLTYLQMFPIQVLKIDKEFIKRISVEEAEKENKIINSVIYLAHSLDLEIVAEGIEVPEQAEYLVINDCDLGQGYYYDKPMAVNDFENKYFETVQ
ncbi:bifunctional diguanylate cyclase/phosphodiesterase [Acidaminobacter sp. JC074]|uniref:putative bifunctional diguanylate cyclase/phosphodiesterase n=1 Tax=Acidaminobacter sp. JC074 TaxID=2530199 RepID=UPI001F0D1CA7|nr:EAL domain-containing protein [Acidaminobacter sp. JC074]